ncbi:DNA-processing protein DprA [Pseudomonas alliivorans]|nr:DNA-processing protein DprA [Pseudomonas alliivorans]
MEDRGYWRHERIAFLALSTLKGVGFRTLYKISKSGISFSAALRDPIAAGLEKFMLEFPAGDFESQKKLWELGVAEAKKLGNLKISLMFIKELRFPQKLAVIHDNPEWLFVQGNIDNLYMPAVSIVGTRKPSDDGIFLTKFVVSALAHHKCVTVSGLALGIDQTAHVESMRYGIPTVAVLGTGILENYPRGSEALRGKILDEGGTIITEYLPSQSYSAENFVRRNRLQAALADLLIPAEWQIKSGTAHTVKFASQYGKKIVNLHLPMSRELKPELSFSEDAYGALCLEIPKDTQFLAGLISVITEPELTSISDPPEYVLPEGSENSTASSDPNSSDESRSLVEPEDKEDSTEPNKDIDPQIPLL